MEAFLLAEYCRLKLAEVIHPVEESLAAYPYEELGQEVNRLEEWYRAEAVTQMGYPREASA